MSVSGSTGQQPSAPATPNPFSSTAASGATAPTAGAQLSTVGQQIIAPGAATSPYEFQYVEGVKLILGPELGAILGLPGNTPISGGQALQAYYDLPAGGPALQDLQGVLYSAGMYANTAGEPATDRPIFGSRDLPTFNAISQAILQAGNTNMGTTMTQVLAAQANTGAGYAEQQNALSPVTAGGNTYQINLTNPQDVYQVTNQVFQSALGRLPTQAEYQSVLQGVQKGQEASQGAQIGQEESMSQQRYQQALTSRTAEHTPAATTGDVPNGPFQSPAEEAIAVLQYGQYKVTPSNVAFVAAWIEQNGGVGNNPLGVSTAGQAASPDQGIQAAVNMLHAPQYQALNAILIAGNASTDQKNGAVQKELSQWSGGAITSLDTKGQIAAATDAVIAQGGQQVPPANPNSAPTQNMSGGNRAIMGLTPGQPTAPQQAAQAQAAAPGAMGVTPATQTPGTSVPAAQVGANGQGMSAPGDSYLPSSTITNVQAPSPDAAAFEAATSGANTTPYYANQAQAGLQAIINLITQGPEKL